MVIGIETIVIDSPSIAWDLLVVKSGCISNDIICHNVQLCLKGSNIKGDINLLLYIFKLKIICYFDTQRERV